MLLYIDACRLSILVRAIGTYWQRQANPVQAPNLKARLEAQLDDTLQLRWHVLYYFRVRERQLASFEMNASRIFVSDGPCEIDVFRIR
jgi:hypothetical protein